MQWQTHPSHWIRSDPLWKSGHTWCIHVIKTNATWTLFLDNIVYPFFFFFGLCKPFIKSWLLSALTSPSTVFHLGKHPPNRNYCVLLCFSQDCQGFQNFAYGHPMKPSHLLPFSSTHIPPPLSLSFFPPQHSFLPTVYPAISSLLSPFTAWSLDCHVSHTPRFLLRAATTGDLVSFYFIFSWKNWLLTFLGSRSEVLQQR